MTPTQSLVSWTAICMRPKICTLANGHKMVEAQQPASQTSGAQQLASQTSGARLQQDMLQMLWD